MTYYIEIPNQIQLQFYLWFGKLQIARYKVDKHELDWTCHKNGKFSDFDNFWKMVFTKSTLNINVMLNNILWVLGCFGFERCASSSQTTTNIHVRSSPIHLDRAMRTPDRGLKQWLRPSYESYLFDYFSFEHSLFLK